MSKQRSRTNAVSPEIHIKDPLIFKSLPLLNIQCHLNYVHFFFAYIFRLDDIEQL